MNKPTLILLALFALIVIVSGQDQLNLVGQELRDLGEDESDTLRDLKSVKRELRKPKRALEARELPGHLIL
ncbi:UNKNOWN [Stylonychia lemnae]|uniref:Uncharacterized protein n=1 Tax=Stylonychia lemnae TaxID=5949 RepID=A0A078AL34_STYLE|nr:UNKNOWN [Stylonychia lemnae]|eukprot:CDW82889.1 UNKNOWN [Stylonychia lemnae]